MLSSIDILRFCVDARGGDVNHGVVKHPDPDLPEAACLTWCLQQPGVLGCEYGHFGMILDYFSRIAQLHDIPHAAV